MYDVVVVGGGIVGLSTAMNLLSARPGLKVALLEKEDSVARHQTSHNSGVIHSGLYYKPGSLKAQNCLRGYQMLTDFCEREEIPFEICGKIVVATHSGQVPQLNKLFDRGLQNGLVKNRKIAAGEIREIEPHVKGVEGIWVPYTGIIDYRTVAERYARRFEYSGGALFLDSKVTEVRQKNGASEVVTARGEVFPCRLVVNCAGLYSDKVAAKTSEEPIDLQIIPFRGEYYQLKRSKEYLVKNLIYPVPDPNFPFLGVHFTRMVNGGVEAGPNAVLAFKREGYSKWAINGSELWDTLTFPGFQKVVSRYWKTGLGEMYRSFSKAAFTKALQEIIPEITQDDLEPGGAGVRAQACSTEGALLDDFAIIETRSAVNVCNAPSPAATSSLSIGLAVSERILARL